MNQTMFSLVNFLIYTIMAVAIFVVVIGKTIGINPDYSNGHKSGYITSFTHKGMIIKSYEGEMNMGGMRKETDAEGMVHTVPNTVSFSVTDESLVPLIEQALEDGTFVTLHYSKWFIQPLSVDSPYIIKKVQ